MVTPREEQNISAVKELLDGVSDAEVQALCIDAPERAGHHDVWLQRRAWEQIDTWI